MFTTHRIAFGPAHERLKSLPDDSVELVVTSPPYPMVEMWDESFSTQDEAIAETLRSGDGDRAFDRMHRLLDRVWAEVARVVRPGGFVCINIGDATRTLGDFRLYSNHSQVLAFFLRNGFHNLPNILWRKPTNAPNKFMGSGMLPAGAYVTLEHEYILIFRKGGKRLFRAPSEKQLRAESAFFWEERNQWFSDVWELRGVGQKLGDGAARQRSGAYPFEIPYRLIQMFSLKGDTVLDPFAGTGTTLLAAAVSARNSIGYELDKVLKTNIEATLSEREQLNAPTLARLRAHETFVLKKQAEGHVFRHHNDVYDCPVMTRQETRLCLPFVREIQPIAEGCWQAIHHQNLLQNA